jgi:osmotically-inducible protein OsmY
MNRSLPLILLSLLMLNSCIVATAGIAAMGVSGAKRSNLKETVSDIKISSVIKAKLIEQGFNDLYKKITIQVLFGKVFLIGYVGSEHDLEKAVDLVKDTEGVVDVINKLKVSKKSNYFDTKQYLVDTYITSSVKAKLLASKNLKSLAFTVITQDNLVYLFGTVDSQEKLEEANSAASYVSGVEMVKSYIVVK